MNMPVNRVRSFLLAFALLQTALPLEAQDAEYRLVQDIAYREGNALTDYTQERCRLCMYYWKQWKCARNRRRQLIRLGIHRAEVTKATRSHRGYWWMAGTSIVQRALDNRWLTERAVPNLKQQWIEMHYGKQNEQFDSAAVNLTGTA